LELIAAFNNSFPKEFQVEALRQLDLTYRESHLVAGSDYGRFSSNIRPQIRVEIFNRRIVELAKKFSLKAEERLTPKKYYFAFLEGKEMNLLVKLGDKGSLKLPTPSNYRRALVANNPEEKQLSLNFEGDYIKNENSCKVISMQHYKESKDSIGNGKICGILIHGESKSVHVNFAQVLVPDSSYSCWLAEVDLLARYSGVISTPKEEVIEIIPPTIRKKDVSEGER